MTKWNHFEVMTELGYRKSYQKQIDSSKKLVSADDQR